MFGSPKPAFGSTSFGSTSFGQNTSSLFGAKPNVSFGSNVTQSSSIFGQTPASTTSSIFGGTSTAAVPFGASSSASTFGQNTGLFGGGATKSLFGSTTQTGFGTTAFGSTPASGASIFGQTTPQATPGSTSLFSNPTSAGTGLFGSTTGIGTGTTVKFDPLIGNDTIVRNGVSSNTGTKHQCITAMKQYESKSLEELRVEDYLANRKGSASTGLTFATSSAAPLTGPVFSSTPASSSPFLTQSKPLFGGSTFGTSQPSTNLFGQPSAGSIFGQSKSLFSTPTSSTGFTFGSSSGGLFTQTQTGPFSSSAPSTGLFGSTPTSQPFGTTFAFNQPQQQASPFGQPSAFSSATTSTPASTGLTFGSPFSSNIFGNKPATSSPSLFSGLGTQPFGAQSSQPSLFGGAQQQKPLFGSTFSPQASSTATPLFGGGLSTQAGSLFGSQTKPTWSFGSTPSTQTGSFAFGGGTPGLGVGTVNFPIGAGDVSALAAQEALVHSQLLAMATSPYGQSPLLKVLDGKRDSFPSPTDKYAQQLSLGKISSDSARRVKPLPPVRSSPRLLLVASPMQPRNSASPSILNDTDETKYMFSEGFVPKNHVKKLVLRPKNKILHQSSSLIEDSLLDERTSLTPEGIGRRQNTSSAPRSADVTDISVDRYNGVVVPRPNLEAAGDHEITTDNVVEDEDHFSDAEAEIVDGIAAGHSVRSKDRCALLNGRVSPIPSKSCSSTSALPRSHQRTSTLTARDTRNGEDVDRGDRGSQNYSLPLPICTRPGYYIEPPIGILEEMVDKDGNCFVEDFTVGRHDYGFVTWKGRVNVANLDMDRLIKFESKEVTVFPNFQDKTPVGQGLNRPAVITLERVWPVKRKTNELIKDANLLKRMHFWESLKKASSSMGAKFVSYSPDTGSWTFEVEHFSKYGFPKELEIADETFFDEDEEDISVEDHSDSDDSWTVPDKELTVKYQTDQKPATALGGIDAAADSECSQCLSSAMQKHQAKVRLIQSAFFETPADEKVTEQEDVTKERRRSPTTGNISDSLHLQNDRPSPKAAHSKSFLETFQLPAVGAIIHLPGPKRRPKLVTPRYAIVLSPLEGSLAFGRKHALLDISAQNVRRFRIGWRGDWVFVSLTPGKDGRGKTAGTTFLPSLYRCTDVMNADEAALLKSLFQRCLWHSELVSGCGRVPLVKPSEAQALLKDCISLCSSRSDYAVLQEHDDTFRIMDDAFVLCAALWGPLSDDTKGSAYNTEKCRLRMLTDWFVSRRRKSKKPAERGNCLKKILDLLLSYKIAEAAELAQRNNYWLLSLIVSQLVCSHGVAALCSQQLKDWKEIQADKCIDDDFLRVFMVCAGIYAWQKSDGTWLYLLDDLEWTEVLSFFVWYYGGGCLCISDAIAKYEDCWKSNDAHSRVPAPLAKASSSGVVPLCGKVKYDLCYHLLKLYTNRSYLLKQMLTTFTWTDDPNDYRLSFLLWRFLSALGYDQLSKLSKESMLSNLSCQLDQDQLWPWAVFVAMHIENDAMRAWQVGNIISHHCDDDVGLQFVTGTLGVASEVLAEAKAARFHAMQMYVEETFSQLDAKEWITANRLFVNHTGPLCVVNGRAEELKKITSPLKAHSADVLGWSLQGEVYDKYLQVLRYLNGHNMDAELPDDKEVVRSHLVSFADKLSSLTCKTPLQRLCRGEMAVKVAALMREVADDQGYSSEADMTTDPQVSNDHVIEKMLELADAAQPEI